MSVFRKDVSNHRVIARGESRGKTLERWMRDLADDITLGDVASTFTSGDATPSVLDNSKFITAGSTAITNFDDGVEGQTITIYRGSADIVITDNATIDTIPGINLTLSAQRPSATFRLASGVWKQVAGFGEEITVHDYGAQLGDTGNQYSYIYEALLAQPHVLLPAGTFRCALAIIVSAYGRVLQGQGKRRTFLKATPATDITQMSITGDYVEVRDVAFQGTYDPGVYEPASTAAAILVNNATSTGAAVTGTRVSRVHFYDQLSAGLYLAGGNQGIYNTVVDDIYSYNCPRYGGLVLFKAVYGLHVTSMLVEDGGGAVQGDDGTDGDAYVASPSAITRANPCVVTKVGHDVDTGDYLYCANIGGMTELNGNTYLATKLTADTFSLAVNSTAFTAFTTGGYLTTLRPCRDLSFDRVHIKRCGWSTVGPGEAAFGVSGWQNVVINELILEDCGFDDITDLSSQTGNYASLWNSGQDGLHRCENVTIHRLIDRRSSNNTLILAGVKNFTIGEIISDNGWRRSSDPGGDTAVIRMTDDTASNSCENVRILSGRVIKTDSKCFTDSFIENECTAATGIYIDWANVVLPGGVARYVENGATTFAGRIGTLTNTSAAAGEIGELLTATLSSGSAVSLTTATAATLTSISLTAGDWDVDGTVLFTLGATTTVTSLVGSISATNNTLDATVGRVNVNQFPTGTVLDNAAAPTITVATTRVSLAATTTYYLVGRATFGVSTAAAYGIIRARRVR